MKNEKLKINVFTFLIFNFAFVLSAQADSTHHSALTMQAFNQGVQLFNAGQFQAALPYFDQAIDHDGEFAEAYFGRAACHHALQHQQAAFSDINQAIRLQSEYVEAYALRGVMLYEAENWDAALVDFDYVLQRKPSDAQSLLGRGVISLKKDHPSAAERDFRQFLKLRPRDPMAPKLRQLLTSLDQDTRRSTPQAAPEGYAGEGAPGNPEPRRVSAASERLGEQLFMSHHQLSESFNRKVLRGEHAEAIGDIQSEPSAPPMKETPSNQGVDIVEPR